MADVLFPWSKHRWLLAVVDGPPPYIVCGDKKGSINLDKLPADGVTREGSLLRTDVMCNYVIVSNHTS